MDSIIDFGDVKHIKDEITKTKGKDPINEGIAFGKAIECGGEINANQKLEITIQEQNILLIISVGHSNDGRQAYTI